MAVTNNIDEWCGWVRELTGTPTLKVDKIANVITMQVGRFKLETTEQELLKYDKSLPENLLFDWPLKQPALRATLIQLGLLNTKKVKDYPRQKDENVVEVTRVLYNVTAEEARGFHADMIILERKPTFESDDHDALHTFKECLAHSVIKTLFIPET